MKMKQVKSALFLATIGAVTLVACAQPTVEVVPTALPTIAPSSTSDPTTTSTPTVTPKPTVTVVPTATSGGVSSEDLTEAWAFMLDVLDTMPGEPTIITLESGDVVFTDTSQVWGGQRLLAGSWDYLADKNYLSRQIYDGDEQIGAIVYRDTSDSVMTANFRFSTNTYRQDDIVWDADRDMVVSLLGVELRAAILETLAEAGTCTEEGNQYTVLGRQVTFMCLHLEDGITFVTETSK